MEHNYTLEAIAAVRGKLLDRDSLRKLSVNIKMKQAIDTPFAVMTIFRPQDLSYHVEKVFA